MSAQLLSGLALFALVACFTPGPNNLMLLTSGVNFGLRRTVPHMTGITIGASIIMAGVGLGLGALFQAVPLLQTVLKILCVAYILWLAWRIARTDSIGHDAAEARPMTFTEAVTFQWVNGKLWMMAVSAVAAYTTTENYFLSLAVVVVLFAVVNIPSMLSWTLFGVALRRLLSDRRRVRIFNGVMAALLVASLLPLLG